jgi:hypothetical protein
MSEITITRNRLEESFFLTQWLGTRARLRNRKIGKLTDMVAVDQGKVAEVTHYRVGRPYGDSPLLVPVQKVRLDGLRKVIPVVGVQPACTVSGVVSLFFLGALTAWPLERFLIAAGGKCFVAVMSSGTKSACPGELEVVVLRRTRGYQLPEPVPDAGPRRKSVQVQQRGARVACARMGRLAGSTPVYQAGDPSSCRNVRVWPT